MPYCPRCREDGYLYDLDCAHTVCEDCATDRELCEGMCLECRKEAKENQCLSGP